MSLYECERCQLEQNPEAPPHEWWDCIDALKRQNTRLSDRFTAPIVCMCGSTRFKQAWIAENARLTQEGNIVLAVGLWGHHERVEPTPEQKRELDDLHKRKIDLCDWVWVLDVGGYIGDSTRSEIEYATRTGRPVFYLSQEYPDYLESVDPLEAEVARLEQWKSEATRVFLDLNIEAIGKELNVPLGHSIADKVLPAIQQFARLREALEAIRDIITTTSEGQFRVVRLMPRFLEIEDIVKAALEVQP